jgi:hypothetical protein
MADLPAPGLSTKVEPAADAALPFPIRCPAWLELKAAFVAEQMRARRWITR